MERKLFLEERLDLILEELREKKTVLVSELSEKFNTSKTTIRSDLDLLEERRLIVRTHGGAILNTGSNNEKSTIQEDNLSFNQRKEVQTKEKESIGKLAANLIHDGDSLFIDGGTTTSSVAQSLLDKKNLTIITNSYSIIETLNKFENSTVYLAGGIVYEKHSIVIGDNANNFISRFKPDKLVLGIDGISKEAGLTVADNNTPAVSAIKQKMIENSKEIIVVTDSSKFGKECLLPIAQLSVVDVIVTDRNISDEARQYVKELDIKLIVAN